MEIRTNKWIYALVIMSVFIINTSSCKKDDDETIKDADGNVYSIVTIGTQIWMVENLKTTKYNDGTAIQLVTDKTEWSNLTYPGYCYYDNNDDTYKDTYGPLYNWHAVGTGKLAPKGWHIATFEEWTTLILYLGGDSLAGGKMKETGTVHWMSPNIGANNSSGFTALPGGFRHPNGNFYNFARYAFYWSQAQLYESKAPALNLDANENRTHITTDYQYDKTYGFSVRCLKD